LTSAEGIHDLRDERPGHLTGAALDRVKAVRPGTAVTLILDTEPSLLMASLNLQLRENLAWDIVEADGAWRVTVRHRGDVAATDVLTLLAADHKRIDGLLARALGLLNRGDAVPAVPLLREFITALNRHVAFEDGELAVSLGAAQAAADQPAAIMLREHREIAQQLALVEAALEPVDATELGIYCAILSGTLAKHEYREEHNLFPLWRAALLRRDATERSALLARAQETLAPVQT
jgi:uncharacterized protein (DUF2249 family)